MRFCPYCGHQTGSIAQRVHDPSLRLVTVLFADVSGFTALSERLRPEEVASIMNACFEAISDPIVRYGGTIDKYIGDAVMARFGVPHVHEDDAVRAIHAALGMQAALESSDLKSLLPEGNRLSMRIGINTGQALAGEVGSAALKQFTLMGDMVNVASRLEHEAEPGGILVGENTYRLAKHAFEFKAMPPMEIRGQSKLVNALVPIRPRISTHGSSMIRGIKRVKLIGRDSELAQLDTHLSEAAEARGKIVALVGEPGVGKSRLAEEFWFCHRDERLARVSASAPSFGESMPYSMLASLIRALLAGEALGDEERITPEELRNRLLPLLPEQSIADAIALLSAILGIADAGTSASRIEARAHQAMLTNIMKILLEARSHQETLLLLLDDMHWIDGASLEVFDRVLVSIPRMRVLVLLMHRPEFSNGWSGMGCYHRIDLEELSQECAMELLTEYIGSTAIPTTVQTRLMEKAGGNPFFLEQLVSTLVESGALIEHDGTWIAQDDVAGIAVPHSIQEILLARLDQLPRGIRQVLEAAAVIGSTFSYGLLEAVADTRTDLADHLRYLCRQEFIYETRATPEMEYSFKHSLTHDVVYDGLLTSRRRALHERAAAAIEASGDGVSGDRLSLLAIHYGKTANRSKALEYAIAAGEHSRRLYAHEDALRHFQRALELLKGEEERARRAEVLEAIGDLYEVLAKYGEAHGCYTQVLDVCSAPVDCARVWRKLGDLAASRGRYAESLMQYRRAEETLGDIDAPDERVALWLSQAQLERSRGSLQSSSAICVKALALADQVDETARASLYVELGEIEREEGHLRTAFGYFEAAAAVWEKTRALDKQALVRRALADVSFHRGDLHEALRNLDTALDLYQRVLDPQGIGWTLAASGRIRLAMGDLDRANDSSNEALVIGREIDDRLLVGNCVLQLGISYIEQGELDRAEELVEQAYAGYKRIRNWRGAARALVRRARLLRLNGQIEPAQAALRRATGLADGLKDPWLQIEIDIERAQIEEEAGLLSEAARSSAAAAAAARDLSDPRLGAIGERILGRVRARQGHRKEALDLLRKSAYALRHSAARLEAARAALDYAVVAGEGEPTAVAMLSFALKTFERTQAQRDLEMAREAPMHVRPNRA